jgi:hypothetical protein
MDRDQLTSALDDLEAALPAMRQAYPDPAEFWPEFAGIADWIEDRAGAADCDYVNERIERMLSAAGLVPPAQAAGA